MPNNILIQKYYERIEPESLSTAQFTPSGSSSVLVFIIDHADMSEFQRVVLGDVKINPNFVADDGYLVRTLPMSHPVFSYMYASKITEVRGLGQMGRILSKESEGQEYFGGKDRPDMDRRTPKFAAVYEKYQVTVEFNTRPYLVFADDQLRGLDNCGANFQYADRDKLTGIKVKTYRDWFEWARFCSLSVEPAVQVLTNNRGSYYFRTDVNLQPAAENGPVDNKEITTNNSSSAYIIVPRNIVKVTWYQVPFEMTKSQTLRDAVNKVNYGYDYGNGSYDLATYGYKFFGYPSGSLLFSGVEFKDYASAVPPYYYDITSPSSIYTTTIKNKYVDIVFNFIEAQIPDDKIGALPQRGVTIKNDFGKIIYGHNMVPFSGNKKYYYLESDQNPNYGWPIYWSHPFQRMFQYIAPT